MSGEFLEVGADNLVKKVGAKHTPAGDTASLAGALLRYSSNLAPDTISSIEYLIREHELLMKKHKVLLEAAKRARKAIEDRGHTNNVPGIAARCPNCDLCELDAAIAQAEKGRP
jgi:hypothetical protein